MFSKVAIIVTALVASATAHSFKGRQTATTPECTYYQTNFDFTDYPTVWTVATTNVSSTAEFQAVYNSINWSKVPNIPPKTKDSAGDLIMTNYSTADPDCWWSASGCTVPKYAGLAPDISYCFEPETLGLTYDDGPNCSHNAFYDYLQQQNQKASLYYIGSNVADWPNEGQRGLADGHHINVHTWSHPLMTTLTNEEVVAELYYTKKVIKYVIGVTPLYWRPPYGDVDDRVRAIATQLNLTTTIWNIDSDDYDIQPYGPLPNATIDANFQAFVNEGTNGTFANSGAILLEHELNAYTMSEAIKWYPSLKGAFKYVVPVAVCMNITHPYVETNYTFPNFLTYTNQTVPSSSIAVPSSVSSAHPTPSNTTALIVNATNSSTSSSAASHPTTTSGASIVIYNATMLILSLIAVLSLMQI